MHELRRMDVLGSLKNRFELVDTSSAKAGITGRDVRGVEKILSGLLKLMYPHGEVNDEQLGELLSLAIEGRQRVRNQLAPDGAGRVRPHHADGEAHAVCDYSNTNAASPDTKELGRICSRSPGQVW